MTVAPEAEPEAEAEAEADEEEERESLVSAAAAGGGDDCGWGCAREDGRKAAEAGVASADSSGGKCLGVAA